MLYLSWSVVLAEDIRIILLDGTTFTHDISTVKMLHTMSRPVYSRRRCSSLDFLLWEINVRDGIAPLPRREEPLWHARAINISFTYQAFIIRVCCYSRT